MMRSYAETRSCRRRHVLTYFGEEYERRCGLCDNCDSGATERVDADGSSQLLAPGVRVRHAEWDAGMVLRIEGDTVVVLFDDMGYKTLSVSLVEEHDLLEVLGAEGPSPDR